MSGLLIAGLVGGQVDADGAPSRAVKAEFTAESTPTSIGAIECSVAGHCIATYTIASTAYHGDVEATSITTGTLGIDQATGAFEGSSYQLITGSVAGCGSGSFIVRLPSFIGRPPEPVTGRGEIVPGSGTGRLTGITGRFAATFETQLDGTGWVVGRLDARCSSS